MPLTIDRNSSVPSYVQIAQILKDRIVGGEIQPGARIPAERELMAQSGLSRITVRNGLALLEREGWIVRKQGLGTFVSRPVDQELSSFRTITEILLSQGITPEIRVMSFDSVFPPARIRRELRLEDRQRLLRVKRLYSYRGTPIALVYIYLPLDMKKHFEVLRSGEVPTETTCTIWENQLGVRLKEARHVIRAAVATREDGSALGVAVGAPILIMERVTYSEDDRPLEYIIYHCHADRYEFSAMSPRKQAIGDTFGLNGRYVGVASAVPDAGERQGA